MKHLIIVISLCIASFLVQGHEYSAEYIVVCKRAEGCPIVNGTCPTCVIVDNHTKKEANIVTIEQIREVGKRMKEEMKYDMSYFENDEIPYRPSGYGWDGPTWKGLWVYGD